jgi:hypothetical protein
LKQCGVIPIKQSGKILSHSESHFTGAKTYKRLNLYIVTS